jgi:aryl-alcohol dehydrogenase-like predicted oxidoreductase
MAGIEERNYGSTNEKVTSIGLGGGSLNKYSYSEGVATVRRALELGITYFDTSVHYGHGIRKYGTGVSQAILGEALEGEKDDYLLATKIGHFYTSDKYRSRDAIRTQIEDNLRLLRRDNIDVLQIHEADWQWWWTDNPSGNRQYPLDNTFNYVNSPVIEVLEESKKRGLSKAIGITGNSSIKLKKVLDSVDVDACLCAFHYNVFHRDVKHDLIPTTQPKGTALILGGVFQCYREEYDSSDKLLSDHPWDFNPSWNLLDINGPWLKSKDSSWMSSELRLRVDRLHSLRNESGLSMMELIMGYMLGDQNITSILIGAGKPSEIEQCARAAERGPLPNDLHQEIERLGN